MELVGNSEIPTYGLQDRCSAAELHQHIKFGGYCTVYLGIGTAKQDWYRYRSLEG